MLCIYPWVVTGNIVSSNKHIPGSFHPVVVKKKYDVGIVVRINNGTAGVSQYQLRDDRKGNIVIMMIGQHTAKTNEIILNTKP
tara:strand:+ start:1373 stop:1621 length:249 start_codon:yes stop_codon:yes gene_type:complete